MLAHLKTQQGNLLDCTRLPSFNWFTRFITFATESFKAWFDNISGWDRGGAHLYGNYRVFILSSGNSNSAFGLKTWFTIHFTIHDMDINCYSILAAYRAHVTPVNTITWNPFHPEVFLRWSKLWRNVSVLNKFNPQQPPSCASEYNVLLWHMDHQVPVLRYKPLDHTIFKFYLP